MIVGDARSTWGPESPAKTRAPRNFASSCPRDGSDILNGWGEVIRDEAGRPLRLIGSVQDITECRRAEETLRFTLAGIARHERSGLLS